MVILCTLLQKQKPMNKNSPMGKIMNTMPQTGEVVWIGVRPEKRADMNVVKKVKANFELYNRVFTN